VNRIQLGRALGAVRVPGEDGADVIDAHPDQGTQTRTLFVPRTLARVRLLAASNVRGLWRATGW